MTRRSTIPWPGSSSPISGACPAWRTTSAPPAFVSKSWIWTGTASTKCSSRNCRTMIRVDASTLDRSVSPAVIANAPQVHEQCVVDERRALDDLRVVFRGGGTEPLADGPEASRFRRDVDLLRKVRAVNDEGETLQSGIAREVLVDELLERAPAARVLMRISRACCVESDRVLAILQRRHLIRLDEQDLRGRIEKSPDQ